MIDNIQRKAIERAHAYLDAKNKDKFAVHMGWLFGMAACVLIYLLAMMILGE